MSDRAGQRKKFKTEVSAGGIVYKKEDDGIFVLLIMPAKRTDTVASQDFVPVFTFPKGWVGDHGEESLTQTAVREVKEEGGVDAKIVSKLGEVSYKFSWDGTFVSKTVHWYLMEYIGGNPEDHDAEVAESIWVKMDDVGAKLKYDTDKKIFNRALDELRS